MKICVPVEVNNGLESRPFGHFGSAPMFVVCDLESGDLSTINNGDLGHEHGMCQPIKALAGNVVDAVIVGGIGQGAIAKLNSMGIKVTYSCIKKINFKSFREIILAHMMDANIIKISQSKT